MRFQTDDGPLDVEISRLVVAGWTGRDAAGVQRHIDELAAIGVAPPSSAPLYYRVAAGLLTQGDEIQVVGDQSSGEAEPVVIRAAGATWLGLGSDHTDRALEGHSVACSKQVCAKPVATALLRLGAIADADALTLSSHIDEGGGWVGYQSGTLAMIRPLAELIEGAALKDGEALFCGTLPAIGGVRPSARFRMTLGDPATGREITHQYTTSVLPVVS